MSDRAVCRTAPATPGLLIFVMLLSVKCVTISKADKLLLCQVEDIDDDETACILANLINDGRIKGYISHQHQKLVVSKQNAFPPLVIS